MKTLNAPADTASFNIDGEDYTVVDGQISVVASHVDAAIRLGCTDPDTTEAALAPVVPILPDVDSEDLSIALIQENEDLKKEIAALTDTNTQLIDDLEKAISALEVMQVERDRAVLALNEAQSATESAADDKEEGGTADSGTQGGDTTEEETAEVVEKPDFDGMEYNPLKEWLKDNGVVAPANLKKVDAVKACHVRWDELHPAASE